ncbi:MAG: site-2 protease family protein [Thermodesulfobacteriota bacterium]|nr:site-2 protease family protein [Thermodesulfobacteriota bacterium]
MDISREWKYMLVWLTIPAAFMAAYPWVLDAGGPLEWLLWAILLFTLFFSVMIHELSHGLAARACGDQTARDAGRLTINPVTHVSLVGSVIFPIILYLFKAPVFGWAKPVPFNPTQFYTHPRDQVWVAMAGPMSNFAVAGICYTAYLFSIFIFKQMNPGIIIGFPFDLFSPIDLSGAGFQPFWFVLLECLSMGIFLNLVLGMFNLIPFPPLDGSWILKAVLPKKAAVYFGKVQIFGFLLIILAIQFNLLDIFFYPLGMMIGFLGLLGGWTMGWMP